MVRNLLHGVRNRIKERYVRPLLRRHVIDGRGIGIENDEGRIVQKEEKSKTYSNDNN
jgi:hypothetical protein